MHKYKKMFSNFPLSIFSLDSVSICRGYEWNSWGIIGLFLLLTVRVQIYGGWNGLNFHLMFSGRKGVGEKRGNVISAGGSDFCCCFSDLSAGMTAEVHVIPLSVD